MSPQDGGRRPMFLRIDILNETLSRSHGVLGSGSGRYRLVRLRILGVTLEIVINNRTWELGHFTMDSTW
jgi:hypothetical protein